MKNAQIIVRASGFSTLNFFNSKEVYSTKSFETERKARNYAKKYGYNLFNELPEQTDVTYIYHG